MKEHTRLEMKTGNLADRNYSLLVGLFPNAVTETIDENGVVVRAIDKDVLAQEVNIHVVEGREERYQFTWPDKRKSILLANAPIAAALRPCREESVDFDTTENLYIEGDNLDVLKLLRETYLNRVKMIYIDPPYNTGHDFMYEDDFAEDTSSFLRSDGQFDEQGNRLSPNLDSNGRFHADWLNMIYPRLRIARDILADDGVIIINMDEHEITNLQKVCAEVFGASNDLGTIIWDKRNPKGDAKGVSYQHEYIILFAKNKAAFLENCKMVRPKKNAEMMIKKAEQLFRKVSLTYTLEQVNIDFQAWVSSQKDLSGGEAAYKYIDANGDVFRSVSMAWPNNKKAPDDYFIRLIHPTTGKPCPMPAKGWRNPSATMRELLAAGLILFGKDDTKQPERKYLLRENMFENTQNLDVGFRVLKLASSNMKNVYYTPEEYAKMNFDLLGFRDNIKPNRSDEDLLFQVMLDLGIPLSAKITRNGDVYHVNDNYLIACFKQVDTALITEIAKQKPYYAVFRDSSFISDSAMVNFAQVFATYSPNTIRRVL
jgi:adenine-specific DNA-methyltransferase